MKLPEWLADLCHQGVELWFVLGKLHYRFPVGYQDQAAVLEQLRSRRVELLEYYTQIPGLTGPYRPSQAQLSMVFQSLIRPGHIGHVLRYPVIVNSDPDQNDLDRHLLQSALTGLAQRHPMLNARFITQDEQVWMFFALHSKLELQLERFEDAGPQRIQAWIEQHSTLAMDLAEGPLCRVHLAINRQPDDTAEYVLMIVAHHIVVDHLSLEIIWRDLSHLYTESGCQDKTPLPATGCGLADLAELPHWQARSADGARQYWQQQLQSVPPPLELPGQQPGAGQSGDGYEFRRLLDADVCTAISGFAEQQRVTEFVVMFTVYGLQLMHRAASEVCIGLTTEGRTGHPDRGLVGCFVNTVPVIFQQQLLGFCLAEAVEQSAEAIAAAVSNAGLPFMELVKLAALERQPQRPVLFQTMFSWLATRQFQQTRLNERPSMELLPYASAAPSRVGVTHDIVLAVQDLPDRRYCNWNFDGRMYALPTVMQLADDYQQLLADALAHPDMPLHDLLTDGATHHQRDSARERFEL